MVFRRIFSFQEQTFVGHAKDLNQSLEHHPSLVEVVEVQVFKQ